MFRISDIRIGVKLAAVSGLGILLVAGMLGTSLYSNAQITAANGSATYQQNLVRDVDHLATAFIKTRLAVRNIRLAMSAEELDAANNLEKQQKDFGEIFAALTPKLRLPANREACREGASRHQRIYRDRAGRDRSFESGIDRARQSRRSGRRNAAHSA